MKVKVFLMQRFFCLFIIFPICIFSNWKELFQEKKDPTIVHYVDVTTGALFLHFTDHLSKGKKEVCYLSYGEKDSESDELLVEPYQEALKIVQNKNKELSLKGSKGL